MTDRHVGYLVTLKKSIREDDAQRLIEAIQLFGPVANVKPIIDGLEHQVAVESVRHEMRLMIFNALKDYDEN